MPNGCREHLCASREAAIFLLAMTEQIQLKIAAFEADKHCGVQFNVHCGIFGTERRLEVEMPASRKEDRGAKAFALPLLGIVLLLASYWVLADWEQLPLLISGALASAYWPG
jgi:hypothetical protein